MGKFKPIPEKMFFKRVTLAIGLLLILILIGTLFLMPKYGSFGAAFAQSASEVTKIPLDGEHALLFFVLALFGYVLAFYIVYVTIEFALEGKLRHLFMGVGMEKKIKNLRNHCIVCGYGRVGKNVAEKLKESGEQVVILERDSTLVEDLKNKGHLCLEGTIEEEDLEKAGIKNAKYLVTCTGDDGKNILIIMAAKELNPSILVASRASDEKIIKKMKYAGATHVVMPEKLGGFEIVNSILKDNKRHSQGGKFYKSH